MKVSFKKLRLRTVWLLVPLYLILSHPTPALLVAGIALAVAGGLVRAWASGTIQKNRVLATGGPYAHTRNPLYLGTFLTGVGLTVAAGSLTLLSIFLAFFLVVYVPTMRREEANLERLFGDRFRKYAASVPLFIPRIRPYRPQESNATEFMLRQYVTNREYEFALGVALSVLALAVKMVLA